MNLFTLNGRRYAQFPRLGNEKELVHAFSTRPFDVSMRADPEAEIRAARRATMAQDHGLDPERLACCVQVHEPRIARLDAAPPGGRLEGFDGAVTAAGDLALMTFSADCPLVLAFDPARRILGVGHASWRCTVARLVLRLVERMRSECGARPDDLLAGVGPSAGPDAYEVKEDVYEAAAELAHRERLFPRRDGRMTFDLWEANRQQFVEAGVPAGQIEVAGLCTMTRTDLFYSFRREGKGCGHFALIAGIRG